MRATLLTTKYVVMISKPIDSSICQGGINVADMREIMETGAVRGKMLKITKIKAFGAVATRLLKKSGMMRGKMMTMVAWLPSFGFGTSAPKLAIKLL